MQVGVHIVLAFRHKPAEVAVVMTVLLAAHRPDPSEKFLVVSFADKGNLVVAESEITVFSGICSAEYASADETDLLHRNVAEWEYFGHRHTRNGLNIRRILACGSADGNLAADIIAACPCKFADGGKSKQGNGPYGLVLADRADVAYLYAHVSGRMLVRLETVEGAG